MKFSPGYDFLAVKRDCSMVSSLNANYLIPLQEFVHLVSGSSCKVSVTRSNHKLLGFQWTSPFFVLIILNSGIELNQVVHTNSRTSLKSVKRVKLAINWFLYSVRINNILRLTTISLK